MLHSLLKQLWNVGLLYECNMLPLYYHWSCHATGIIIYLFVAYGHKASQNVVNVGSGNGLLPHSTV